MKTNWLNIVLYRPEIPQNTGNIGRTCVGLNIPLHIIGRPSFFLEDKHLKRAGLDYWEKLNLFHYEDWADFFLRHSQGHFYFFTKKGRKNLFDVSFQERDFLIFGRETDGLPQDILEKYADYTVSLPMSEQIRSFNLSNTVAVSAFEAFRQIQKQS